MVNDCKIRVSFVQSRFLPDQYIRPQLSKHQSNNNKQRKTIHHSSQKTLTLIFLLRWSSFNQHNSLSQEQISNRQKHTSFKTVQYGLQLVYDVKHPSPQL